MKSLLDFSGARGSRTPTVHAYLFSLTAHVSKISHFEKMSEHQLRFEGLRRVDVGEMRTMKSEAACHVV